MDLHRSSTPLGSAAVVRGLDLVDRVGNRHRIPTVLVGAPEIVRWVTRHCSDPLRVDASRALSDGETLTFGKIQIDREGIRGASWASRWQDLSLVRHVPGAFVCSAGSKSSHGKRSSWIGFPIRHSSQSWSASARRRWKPMIRWGCWTTDRPRARFATVGAYPDPRRRGADRERPALRLARCSAVLDCFSSSPCSHRPAAASATRRLPSPATPSTRLPPLRAPRHPMPPPRSSTQRVRAARRHGARARRAIPVASIGTCRRVGPTCAARECATPASPSWPAKTTARASARTARTWAASPGDTLAADAPRLHPGGRRSVRRAARLPGRVRPSSR